MKVEKKNKKDEHDRAKALDMTTKAMEKVSDTKNRKTQEQDEEPKKKSPGDLLVTLLSIEKNEVEFGLRRQEMDMRKKEQDQKSKREDETAKRQDDIMKMMVQQNQMMMDLINQKASSQITVKLYCCVYISTL